MTPLRINFASGTARKQLSLLGPASWGACLVAAITAGLLTSEFLEFKDQQAQLRAESEDWRQKIASQTSHFPVATENPLSEEKANAVNLVIRQLNLPWQQMFESLEVATPTSIALLSIEPDAKQRLIKGVAETKSSNDLFAYMEILRQQPFLKNIALRRQEINERDPNRPIRFHFEAEWADKT